MPFIPVPQSEQPKPPCNHPEHNPPNMIVLSPGLHRYQCPACGQITDIFEPIITC